MTDIIEGRDDFDSVLGRLDNPVGGTIALTLTVKTYIQLVAPGSFHFEATLPVPGNPSQTSLQPQTLTVSQAPPDALSQFQQRFADTIDHAWNGKLWLVHGGTTRQRSDGSRIYNVRCRVRIQYVSQPEAQLIMQLLWQPTGNGATTFRQNCHRGGIGRPHGGIRDALRNAMGLNANPRDMQLLDDSCGERTLHFPASDCSTNGCTHAAGRHPFQQCVAAHEFGHYLGLPHACAAAGVVNSTAQYCIGNTIASMEDQMAVGNTKSIAHTAPWLARLREHGYGPRTWSPRTTAPPNT